METIVRISQDEILVDNVLYRTVKTADGRYPTEIRRQYMRNWRAKRRLLRIIK